MRRARDIGTAALLVLTFGCVTGPQAAAPSTLPSAKSRYFFYRLSGASGEAFLFGSVHVGQEDFYPLPNAVTDAFSRSKSLAVELDVSAIQPEDVKPVRAPIPLRKALGPATLRELEKQFGREPMQGLSERDICEVRDALTLGLVGSSGYSPAYGVDLHFIRQARNQRKSIVALETLDEQLRAVSMAELSERQIIDYCGGALESLAEEDDASAAAALELRAMIQAWKAGDDSSLLQLSAKDAENVSPGTLAAAHKILIADRHGRMSARIREHLDRGETLFIVVGAMHLVGEDSLVAYLRRLGYKVERI